jgi:glutathione S-transferase
VTITLHGLSGSPYAWRVALALEHKGLPYTLRLLSYDAGDFASPAFAALNPRRRVPVIEDDDGFVLYESAAIVEYLEDRAPGEPRLFAADS